MASSRTVSTLQAHLTGLVLGVGIGLFGILGGLHHIAGVPSLYVATTGGVAGAVLGGRWGRLVLGVALACLVATVLLAWTPIVERLAAPLVRNDAAPRARPDALFVFSGGVTHAGLLRGQGLDRIVSAMALRDRWRVGPMVLSEIRFSGRTGASSRADQRALLSLAGIRDTTFVTNVASTHDEAVLVARLASQRGWRTVVAVTSPAHTRRACATLARAGVRVICHAAAGRATPWPPRTPTERLQLWPAVAYEYAAWVVFRLRGWAAWDGD